MKTLKLTIAAVVLSAFTMTAQQDAKAATTKTEVSQEAKEEVRAPHKMAEQNRATNKVAIKSATSQDADVVNQPAPGKAIKPIAKKAKAVKTVLTEDEKAVQAGGKKIDN
jgi:Ni/Co efflux regulator RcnB